MKWLIRAMAAAVVVGYIAVGSAIARDLGGVRGALALAGLVGLGAAFAAVVRWLGTRRASAPPEDKSCCR